MAMEYFGWHVIADATNDEAYAILARDPVWNCFALADLELPLRDYSQFAVASHDDGNESAICLILRHPIIGEVLSPFGNEEGVAAILNEIALPEQAIMQVQEQHMRSIQRHYQPVTRWRSMLRMAISAPSWQAPGGGAIGQVAKRLTGLDLADLKDLYSQYPESMFSVDLFTQGLYVGIYEGERIVAAGGTHAMVAQHGIAVLGHILTAREARKRGYATEVTAVLVAMLMELGYTTVVLNVFEENEDAVRVYRKLGFKTYHRLLTGYSSRIEHNIASISRASDRDF